MNKLSVAAKARASAYSVLIAVVLGCVMVAVPVTAQTPLSLNEAFPALKPDQVFALPLPTGFSMSIFYASFALKNPAAAISSSAALNETLKYNSSLSGLFFCDPYNGLRRIGTRVIVVEGDLQVEQLFQRHPSLVTALLDSDIEDVRFGVLVRGSYVAICGPMGTVYKSVVEGTPAAASCSSASIFYALPLLVVVEALHLPQGAATRSALALDSLFSSSFALSPADPTVANMDPNSFWCSRRRAESGTLPHVAVGSVVPRVVVLFEDVYGNPSGATASQPSQDTSLFIQPWPRVGSVSTNQPNSTSSSAPGAYCLSVAGLIILGATTALPSTTEAVVAGPILYEFELTSASLMWSDSSQACRRFQLLPGVPTDMLLLPATSYIQGVASTANPFALSSPHYIVADHAAVAVTVSLRDHANNTLAVARPCINSVRRDCVSCFLSGTTLTLSPKTSSASFDTSTTFLFLPTPVVGTMYVNVTCYYNTSRYSSTVHASTALHVVPREEYDCYDGEAAFETSLSAADLDDIQSALYNSGFTEVPFSRFYLSYSAPDWYGISSRQVLLDWVVVPKQGYIYIPLGFLSVMAFGATYTKITTLELHMKNPPCRSLADRAMEERVAAWLYTLGDNVSSFYVARTSSNPTKRVDDQLEVCHGSGIGKMEFVSLTCCDRLGSCVESNLESPLTVLLLVGAVLIGILVAAFTASYLYSIVQKTPVHMSNRHQMSLSEKGRVVVAHVLAPWVLAAHSYFIFDLSNTSAYVLFYLDVCISGLWGIALLVRFFLPLHLLTTPLYIGVGMAVLCYSQFILGNSAVWTLTALHLNVRLLPFSAASILIIVQVFWSMLWASQELQPSIFEGKMPEHSIVPIDAALSIEYFAIVVTLFMFTVSEIDDITRFGAILAAFGVMGFACLYNYSLTRAVAESTLR